MAADECLDSLGFDSLTEEAEIGLDVERKKFCMKWTVAALTPAPSSTSPNTGSHSNCMHPPEKEKEFPRTDMAPFKGEIAVIEVALDMITAPVNEDLL